MMGKIMRFYAKQITKRIDTVLRQRAEEVTRIGQKRGSYAMFVSAENYACFD
jgi:hypothetical protein